MSEVANAVVNSYLHLSALTAVRSLRLLCLEGAGAIQQDDVALSHRRRQLLVLVVEEVDRLDNNKIVPAGRCSMSQSHMLA